MCRGTVGLSMVNSRIGDDAAVETIVEGIRVLEKAGSV
jgi:hypothetical protein